MIEFNGYLTGKSKKLLAVVISVLLLFSVTIVAINYLYPYYVHWSSIKYADEVKASKVDKGNIILCSKITEDETVNSMYITFYILDKDSQKTLFECLDGWRLRDFKYLGFEKGTYNILAMSGDVGTYRYVYDGQTWKEQNDYDKEYVPDSQLYLINNLDEE